MALPELKLAPDNSAYSVKDGSQVVTTQLGGGAGRYRRDILGATSRVSVTWKCDPSEYQYLKSFHRATLSFGALPFSVGLVLDTPELVSYKAYFVPDSLQLQSQQGLTYVVIAELEVYPLPVTSFDSDYVQIFDEFGPYFAVFEAMLHQIVNVDLPRDIAQ